MNKERVYTLIAQKRMTPVGLDAIAHVFDPSVDKPDNFVIPVEILQSLKANKQAWTNFQSFPNAYKRIRIAYIESRKRHGDESYQKALSHFIAKTAINNVLHVKKVLPNGR